MKDIEKSNNKPEDKNNVITGQENVESSNFEEDGQGNNDEKKKSYYYKKEKIFDSKGSAPTEERKKEEKEENQRINETNNVITGQENKESSNFEGCEQGIGGKEHKIDDKDDLYNKEKAIDSKGTAKSEKKEEKEENRNAKATTNEKEENEESYISKKNENDASVKNIGNSKTNLIIVPKDKVFDPKIKNKGNGINKKSLEKNSISPSPSSEKELNEKLSPSKINVDRNGKAKPSKPISFSDKNKKENIDAENGKIYNGGSMVSIVLKKTYSNEISPKKKNSFIKFFCKPDNSAQNLSIFIKGINGEPVEEKYANSFLKENKKNFINEKMKNYLIMKEKLENLKATIIIKKTYSNKISSKKKNLFIKFFCKPDNSEQKFSKFLKGINGEQVDEKYANSFLKENKKNYLNENMKNYILSKKLKK